MPRQSRSCPGTDYYQLVLDSNYGYDHEQHVQHDTNYLVGQQQRHHNEHGYYNAHEFVQQQQHPLNVWHHHNARHAG